MLRTMKYAIIILVCIFGVITLLYSLDLFVAFSEGMRSLLKRISIIACILLIAVLTASFIYSKYISQNRFQIFNETEYKIFHVATLVFFAVFTVSFIVKTSIADWERGSDIYITAMTPVVIPLFSGTIVEIVHWISR